MKHEIVIEKKCSLLNSIELKKKIKVKKTISVISETLFELAMERKMNYWVFAKGLNRHCILFCLGL